MDFQSKKKMDEVRMKELVDAESNETTTTMDGTSKIKQLKDLTNLYQLNVAILSDAELKKKKTDALRLKEKLDALRMMGIMDTLKMEKITDAEPKKWKKTTLSPSTFKPEDHKAKLVIEIDDEMEDHNVEEEEPEIVESDVEFDESFVVEPDDDPPQQMGDRSLEATFEDQELSRSLERSAIYATSEGELEGAIELLTDAIILNPKSAITYAVRAGVYIGMKKPNAAIRDANVALEIDPRSAEGYKYRGIARAMLGQWEESLEDLLLASKFDYDEEISEALQRVEPNVRKLEEHRRKYEQLFKERKYRQRR